jgi:hypothetical protein
MASNARIFFAGIGTQLRYPRRWFRCRLDTGEVCAPRSASTKSRHSRAKPRDKSYFASFRRTDTTNRGGSAGTSA